MGAQKVRTTSFHAQCNGGVERINKIIKPCLAKLLDTEQDDWDIYLPMAISSYNNSVHRHDPIRGSFWAAKRIGSRRNAEKSFARGY